MQGGALQTEHASPHTFVIFGSARRDLPPAPTGEGGSAARAEAAAEASRQRD